MHAHLLSATLFIVIYHRFTAFDSDYRTYICSKGGEQGGVDLFTASISSQEETITSQTMTWPTAARYTFEQAFNDGVAISNGLYPSANGTLSIHNRNDQTFAEHDYALEGDSSSIMSCITQDHGPADIFSFRLCVRGLVYNWQTPCLALPELSRLISVTLHSSYGREAPLRRALLSSVVTVYDKSSDHPGTLQADRLAIIMY